MLYTVLSDPNVPLKIACAEVRGTLVHLHLEQALPSGGRSRFR